MKVKVLRIFRDKFTKELYSVGGLLELEDKSRIKDLTTRGLVELVEDKKGEDPGLITLFDKEIEKKTVLSALKAIGEKASWNMKDETIIDNVSSLDEEKASALKKALGIE